MGRTDRGNEVTDDDVLSLAIFMSQNLGYEWANLNPMLDCLSPSQDDFIRVATMVLDLQKNG